MKFRDFSICLLFFSSAGAALGAERLTLVQAVSEALDKNAGLLAERANISIADARILTARLRPNPVLNVAGDHLDILGTGFNDANGGGPTEIAVGAEWTLERSAKRRARVETAQAARSVADLQFANAARLLTNEVQNLFLDVVLARENLELARGNEDSYRQIVQVNEARVHAGDLAEVELIRARLALLQSQNTVRQAELKHRDALTRLQTRMGRSRPSPDLEVSRELPRRASLVPSLGELRDDALRSRPDLLALRRDATRSGLDVRAQLENAKSDPTLGTEYRRQQVNAKANALTVSISIPLRVFDRNQGEIERARQEQRQAELRTRALETDIAGEVENAWQQYSTARTLLETIETQMLQQARDVREITDFSYRRGEASLLQLLDAQRAFNDTMQAYNEARTEHARSLYLLDSVSGKGISQP
jgi:outer membrane protein, heavy metal efflux system